MIDLNKEEGLRQEPSQQEIQDFVNRVYAFAANLYTEQNYSWNQVKSILIKEGINEKDAETVVENLKEQEEEEKREAANKEIGYGFLWLVGGIALTAITQGQYLFWGAVLWGSMAYIKRSIS